MYEVHINFINQERKTMINSDNPDCHKTTLKIKRTGYQVKITFIYQFLDSIYLSLFLYSLLIL